MLTRATYRALLVLLPRHFRRRHGEAMLQLFEEMRHEARRTGSLAEYALLLREATGLVRSAFQLRFGAVASAAPGPYRARETAFIPRPRLATTACLLGVAGVAISVVNTVHNRSQLPRDLVSLSIRAPAGALSLPATHDQVIRWRRLVDVFAAVDLFAVHETLFRTRTGQQRVVVVESSANMLDLLRIDGMSGELEAEKVGALISHDLWLSQFGGASDLGGLTVDILGRSTPVRGVLPAGQRRPDGVPGPLDIWLVTASMPIRGWAVARLRRNVTIEHARERLSEAADGNRASSDWETVIRAARALSEKPSSRAWTSMALGSAMLVVLAALTARGNQPLLRPAVATAAALAYTACTAGLIAVRTVTDLSHRSLGFSPEGLTAIRVRLTSDRFVDDAARRRAFEKIARTASRGSPARLVSVGDLPFEMGVQVTQLHADGRRVGPVELYIGGVHPGFIRAIGQPLLQGRDFTPSDTPGPVTPVLISESTAMKLFPHGAIGGRIEIHGEPVLTVIGVVGDLRARGLEHPGNQFLIYHPLHHGTDSAYVIARASGEDPRLVDSVYAAVRSTDPTAAIDPAPLPAALYASVAHHRRAAAVPLILSIISLLVTAFSVHGAAALTRDFRNGRLPELLRNPVSWIALGILAGFVVVKYSASLLLPFADADIELHLAAGMSVVLAGAAALPSLFRAADTR